MTHFAFLLVSVLCVRKICVFACPDNVRCKSTLDPQSCSDGTYFRENSKTLGCCPSCVPLKEMNETCESSEECAPGLSCNEICSLDKSQECEHFMRTDSIWTQYKYWKPLCLPDGKFGPKQCKGERLSGKCFCTNERGTRLFGERDWLNAENMKCGCSRWVDIIRRSRPDVSIHCDESGNFEELQCDDRICWCANVMTGAPYTPVVPETMLRVLPCFDSKTFGFQYLRQCDSVVVHSIRAVQLLEAHGTTNMLLFTPKCGYDGSYSRVQTKSNRKYCVYKNNQKLLSDPTEEDRNCNCIYDEFVRKSVEGKEFHYECTPAGDYKTKQYSGNRGFFVDSDGFPYHYWNLNPYEEPRSRETKLHEQP